VEQRSSPVRLLVDRLACAVTWLLSGTASANAGAIVRPDSVGVYSEELEGADWAAAATTDVRSGVGIVRQPFYWSRIETSFGHLDFSVYDHVVAAAAKAGLRLLPVVMNPPAWRSTAPARGASRGMYPPRDPAAMAALATALVQRYGPAGSFWAQHRSLTPSPIRSWQVWNEPNIPAFWASGPNPTAYAQLLKVVGAAIRAADPGAEVVAAGLPPFGGGYTITEFLDRMYAAGARGTFDTMAIHPYAPTAAGVLSVLQEARDELDRLGDPDRPLWATEFGWATGGPRTTITVTEAAHATVVHDALSLLQGSRDELRLRGYIMFRLRDVPTNAGQADIWPLHAGLLRRDGTPKPALAAFRDAAVAWLYRDAPAQAARAATDATPDTGIERVDDTLRIRRRVAHGRLVVDVSVASTAPKGRLRIRYAAIREGHAVSGAARTVSVRRGVAHASFKLSRRGRSAPLLRVTATLRTLKATSVLRRR
jgi:Glycosyl hydrolase catalytic core